LSFAALAGSLVFAGVGGGEFVAVGELLSQPDNASELRLTMTNDARIELFFMTNLSALRS
jgi:hypothetical protein